jgi:hypothetical protein
MLIKNLPLYAVNAILAAFLVIILSQLLSDRIIGQPELSSNTARALADLFIGVEPAETRARVAAKEQALAIPGFHNELGEHRCCLLISHAGGTVDEKLLTNSLEALESSYAAGRRIIEVDFLFTSDGELVLAHDWDGFGGIPPSARVWRQAMEQEGLTPLDIVTLSQWLLENPDAVVVTDTKEDFPSFFKLLNQHLPNWFLQQSFVFQVYNLDDLRLVLRVDSRLDTLLTLYKWNDFIPEYLEVSEREQLLGVTIPIWRLEPLLADLRQRYPDLPIYLHGPLGYFRNSERLRYLRDEGATGFYID